jgi:hypothetical protein
MNPDRIYSQYRDDALARNVSAKDYTTFVAMPFTNSFSYRFQSILDDVIRAAAKCATELKQAKRPFAPPHIVSDGSRGGVSITEAIVEGILHSHIFLADLTFNNPGVLLETGIAMGMKPNDQIILITQGSYQELHFDIRNNNVFCYNGKDAIMQLADRFVSAANSFESEADRRIRFIKERLSPDAIALLRAYPELRKQHPDASLHAGIAAQLLPGCRACERFDAAACELLENHLLRTDWQPKVAEGVDIFGMHATAIGSEFIRSLWGEPELPAASPKPA